MPVYPLDFSRIKYKWANVKRVLPDLNTIEPIEVENALSIKKAQNQNP
ncbi:MAG: hypothetical protein LBE70_03615 [Nitrososphaerota archaeon]|nr:hypothetical protein [Nitrososphaerota archaeon]